MSTRRPKRFGGRNWCFDLMPKPWYIDVLIVGLVAMWMGWTFTTMQQYGPDLALILGAVFVGVVGILLVYGQRLTFLRIGDRLVVGFDAPESDTDELEREKYR